jgi:hypothetical protein
MDLVVGKFQTKDDLAAVALQFNKERNKSHKVTTSNKERMVLRCATYHPVKKGEQCDESDRVVVDENCRFCITARRAPNGDDQMVWTIKIADLDHTCSQRNDGSMVRTKNYNRRTLEKAYPEIAAFIPNKKGGSAKQLTDIAKASTGIELKASHAHSIVASKEASFLEHHIGQYMLLESYLDLLREADPSNAIVIEKRPCRWSPGHFQFKRYYIALSCVKQAWLKSGVRIVAADATFTTSKHFKHTLLIAVTFDGNNELMILALAVVDIENGDNWLWFSQLLVADFPGITVILADYSKGMEAENFQTYLRNNSILYSRCARHLVENCKKNCTSNKLSKDVETFIITKLAQSRTQDLYRERLQVVRAKSPQAADWLDERCRQFVSFHFLQEGKNRHGKVTSNAAENINSALLPMRSEGILFLTSKIVNWMLTKAHKREIMAGKWVLEHQLLTDYALKEHTKTMNEAAKRTVTILNYRDDWWEAQVSASPLRPTSSAVVMHVKVNPITFATDCPCLYYNEYGMPCIHVMALILHRDLSPNDVRWYDTRFQAIKLQEMYTNQAGLSLNLTTHGGKLKVNELIPPDYRTTAGRPKTKRYTSSSVRPRCCHNCGVAGHMAKSCPKPDTEYRYERFKEKARSWAESVACTEDYSEPQDLRSSDTRDEN